MFVGAGVFRKGVKDSGKNDGEAQRLETMFSFFVLASSQGVLTWECFACAYSAARDTAGRGRDKKSMLTDTSVPGGWVLCMGEGPSA